MGDSEGTNRWRISPARLQAFKVLERIEKNKSYSSILLARAEKELSRLDRALCHELCLGVLRRKLLLDKIIEKLTFKKPLDLEIKIILRLGIYQLAFLNKIPRYAVVNEAVEMAAWIGKRKAKGVVNSVLRRFDSRNDFPSKYNDELDRVSIETSHPRFLIERWIKQFGFEQTIELANANNTTPPLEFRFTAKTSDDTKSRASDFTVKELLELADKGEIYFQELASQKIAEALKLSENESFLDVCCAPGSKFTLINYLAPESFSGLFVGGDFFLKRLKTVRENCEKLGVKNYHLVAYDAQNCLPFADETFDVILLDAPCSGTGTIRSNPELRYFLREEDFQGLSRKQSAMLREAARILKKGGRLLYSTCSLEREENEDVVHKFLNERSEFSIASIPDLEQFRTDEGFFRTFPHRNSMNGFFIAFLRKK